MAAAFLCVDLVGVRVGSAADSKGAGEDGTQLQNYGETAVG